MWWSCGLGYSCGATCSGKSTRHNSKRRRVSLHHTTGRPRPTRATRPPPQEPRRRHACGVLCCGTVCPLATANTKRKARTMDTRTEQARTDELLALLNEAQELAGYQFGWRVNRWQEVTLSATTLRAILEGAKTATNTYRAIMENAKKGKR